MGYSPHTFPCLVGLNCVCVLEERKAQVSTINKHKLQIMKYLTPILLATFVLVGCDKQKAAIEDNKEATKNAIDTQKEAVDAAAKEAKKQTDMEATIEKAKIEAQKVAAQAQLDAEKKKADAQAAFEKAKVDAEKK